METSSILEVIFIEQLVLKPGPYAYVSPEYENLKSVPYEKPLKRNETNTFLVIFNILQTVINEYCSKNRVATSHRKERN